MRKVDKDIWALESASLFLVSYLPSMRFLKVYQKWLADARERKWKGANGATFNRFRELLEVG